MILTDEEKRMPDGEYATATQNAMDFLKTLGEGLGAEKMVRVTSAHISSTLPTEFLEQMTEGVTETSTLVSLLPYFSLNAGALLYWLL